MGQEGLYLVVCRLRLVTSISIFITFLFILYRRRGKKRGGYEWGKVPINKGTLPHFSLQAATGRGETHRKLNYHTVSLPLGSRYFLFRRRSRRNSSVKSLQTLARAKGRERRAFLSY